MSPFLELPAELRLHILRYLLPHNQTISVGTSRSLSRDYHYASRFQPTPRNAHVPSVRVETAILCVNKQIHDEAMGVLYSQNIFVFAVTIPTGPYGQAFTLVNSLDHFSSSAVERLTKIEIAVEEDLADRCIYKKVQQKLKDIVLRIGDDHRIRSIKIGLLRGTFPFHRYWAHRDDGASVWVYHQHFRTIRPASDDIGRYQYCLEPLAELSGIDHVEVTGHVETRFAERLAAVIQRPKEDKTLPMVEYGTIRYLRKRPHTSGIKRKHNSPRKPGKVEVARKKRLYTEPTIDWDALPASPSHVD
ncbi:hypothetical protein K469DRAFT_715051 [Zopfia rhizophila CBS 207.26]|uniref:2EXR domain-containing protein n=1 Tax=Zopfia rhizophila CBS 207.26 TaxID=1314779 RepID=A0A6A6EPC8_9PEZI|nr:hypothetical protein K469DRAFT_715051 [Zopfia rhizophila CBS 207.26]